MHALIPCKRNARTHSKRQIEEIARSIKRFGFVNPVLIDDDFGIIAGHGRVQAAKLLGLDSVPAIRLSHLGAAEQRAYVLADNRLAEKAGWDRELLALELQGLMDLQIDLGDIGFASAEVDLILDAASEADPAGCDGEDAIPASPASPTTRPGDLWLVGRHRLLCR